MKRPAIVIVGSCRARAIRAPKAPRPAAEWYWRAEVHENGGHRTVWTGWATRPDAEAHLVALVAGGGLQVKGEASATEIRTVRDLLECWMGAQRDRSDLRPSTVEAYKVHAKAMAELFGSIAVDRLTRRDLDAYVRSARLPPSQGQARRTARAESTLHTDFTVLKAAWSWGRSLGCVPDHELVTPEMSTDPVRPKHTPTVGEIAEVLPLLPAWVSLLLRVQYATGARLGELASLRIGDLDLRANTLRLTGKTGARTFPLQAAVARELAEVASGRPASDRLWTQSENTIRAINRKIRAALAKVGGTRWTTHAIRRTAVDRLMRTPGVDIATAADLLGHSPTVLLRSYRQVTQADRRAAVDKALAAFPAGEVIELDTARTSGAHKPKKG